MIETPNDRLDPVLQVPQQGGHALNSGLHIGFDTSSPVSGGPCPSNYPSTVGMPTPPPLSRLHHSEHLIVLVSFPATRLSHHAEFARVENPRFAQLLKSECYCPSHSHGSGKPVGRANGLPVAYFLPLPTAAKGSLGFWDLKHVSTGDWVLWSSVRFLLSFGSTNRFSSEAKDKGETLGQCSIHRDLGLRGLGA